jgi:hypothetical protein
MISHGRYFDSVLLKTEFSIIHSSEKCLIALHLNRELPEVAELSTFLLTVPAKVCLLSSHSLF